jgi:hypothetical protein
MNTINIFCLDNSELKEYDSIDRGYRSDIYVSTNNEFYNLNIYDIVRLQQDFEAEVQSNGFFGIEPNLIIVKNVDIATIKHTINRLYKQKYFDKIKPLLKDDVASLRLIDIT